LNLTGLSRQGYATNPPTWASNNPNGNGWFELIAEAQFYSKSGGIAVAAVGRASDYTTGTPHQVYAFAGMGMADIAGAVAEGMYLEAIATVAGANANCIEVDAINAGAAVPTINPYQTLNVGAVAGIVVASGGGAGERPGPLYPASAAIIIDRNANNFIRGIVFGAGGINGTDGTTGTGIAVQMAKGHEIQWTHDNSGARNSFIRSDMNVATGTGILFSAGAFFVVDTASETPRLSVTAAGMTNVYGGIAFQGAPASASDLAHGLALYGSTVGLNGYANDINLNVPTGGNFNFVINTASIGFIDHTGINYLPIGQTGAAAGTFTTLTANNVATLNSGLSFANAVAPGGVTDLSKHIMLGYGGIGFNITSGSLNYVATSGNVHSFVVNGVVVGTIGANGIMTGPAGSPTWTSGSAAPAATAPVGSLYSRTGGAVGTTLYVSRGGGTWAAVAGV
jgi:hypothetical protein